MPPAGGFTLPFPLALVVGLPMVLSACAVPGRDGEASGRVAHLTADILLLPSAHLVAARVGAGATLASILHAHHVADEEVATIVRQASEVFDLRKVRAEQPYRFDRDDDGAVRWLEYEIDGDRRLSVRRTDASGGSFVAELQPISKARASALVRGGIDRERSSLVAAMDAAGETVDLALALADIYSGEIDFNIDLQPGDTFQLVVDKQFRVDRPLVTGTSTARRVAPDSQGRTFAGYGPIVAVEFANAGRHLRAIRFAPEGGSPGYYDEHGVSMRRFLLKSPLKFQPVVTSAFSRTRLHPILREIRPHLGVDYRAPSGAPVVAVADGVVVGAGTAGDAGRMVRLRHANGYESEYLHLSVIAVRAGARVHQGDLIGRVGATGQATGPHLDYRVRRNGAFVNPLTAQRAMPPADPVAPAQVAAFWAVRDHALAELASVSVGRAAVADQTLASGP